MNKIIKFALGTFLLFCIPLSFYLYNKGEVGLNQVILSFVYFGMFLVLVKILNYKDKKLEEIRQKEINYINNLIEELNKKV